VSEKSAIEWTHTYHDDGTVTPGSTWNPIRGQDARHTCARISPGCDNCYAATMTRRGLMGTAPIDYGTGETLNDPARLDEKALRQPLGWKKPRKVFVCSMTDLFGTWVPDEWLDRIFDAMENEYRHTFIVLTKRPTRMRDYINRRWTGAYQPQFIWLGTTIESDTFAWRAERLRQTNAAVRWVSAEPLLSGLPSLDLTGIDWLVTGGESGAKARPMHPQWVRDLRDRCQENGTAFFHKQWGEWGPSERDEATHLMHANGNYCIREEAPYGVEHGEPDYVDVGAPDWARIRRIGRVKTGRLLDGVEHNAFPEAPARAEVGQ
jgi:protein gp37